MRRNSRLIKLNTNSNSNNRSDANHKSLRVDSLDTKIIEFLTFGYNNKQISDKLNIPLSTIQRRTRKLNEKELIVTRIEPNYEKLGFKRGLLHIYLSKGEVDSVGQKVSKMNGIISASVHVGNSDIVGFFIYRNTQQLLKLTSDVKKISGVDKVMWSEEVYSIKIDKTQSGATNLFQD
jgi:Lrp/AsnC family transcriptional regulator for asnA, asnC and gidA